MNAIELANNLDKHYGFKKQFPQTADDVIAMLRQQADEIAELKNARDYWCLQYKDVMGKLDNMAGELMSLENSVRFEDGYGHN